MTGRYSVCLAGLVLAACGGSTTGPGGLGPPGLASCASGTAIFTTPPVAIEKLYGWVPLGALNPPGHTLPTDHQYLYVNLPNAGTNQSAVAVVAPGAITVVRAQSTQYHELGRTDYAIEFQPCADLMGQLAHIEQLDPTLAAGLGPFDQGCNTYSPNPGLTVTQCATRSLNVRLDAGAPIGAAGGVPGVYGLDFSLWDRRIPALTFAQPSRYPASQSGFDFFHVVAASEYFTEAAHASFAGKVGRFDGTFPRTSSPVGGTHAEDVPGSAQGNWFKEGAPTYPEGPHLALVPDNVDPSVLVFSVGLSQPRLGPGVYRFVPQPAGAVNREFRDVAPGESIQCYEAMAFGVVLVALVDASTLRVEARPGAGSCAGLGPLSFGADAVVYRR